MRIDYFSGRQDDVFIPALAFGLIATLIIVLIVVFYPGLQRMRKAPRRAIGVIGGVIAAAAIVAGIAQAVAGFGLLAPQRASLQQQIETRYGISVSDADASLLLDGDTLVNKDSIKVPTLDGAAKVHLEFVESEGGYILTTSGVKGELPQS